MDLPDLQLRAPGDSTGIVWCAPVSRTSVVVSGPSALPSRRWRVRALLQDAYIFVADLVKVQGDSVVAGGAFHFLGTDKLFVNTWIVNNHQMTWGVLGSALTVLEDFMLHNQLFTEAAFTIWDGSNQAVEGVVKGGKLRGWGIGLFAALRLCGGETGAF